MSYETTLEHAIRAAAEGAISVGGSWRRLPLETYLPAGRAVREILAEAEIIIAERNAFKAEVERLKGVAVQALAIAEAPDIHGALEALKTALEPAAVVNRELTTQERKT